MPTFARHNGLAARFPHGTGGGPLRACKHAPYGFRSPRGAALAGSGPGRAATIAEPVRESSRHCHCSRSTGARPRCSNPTVWKPSGTRFDNSADDKGRESGSRCSRFALAKVRCPTAVRQTCTSRSSPFVDERSRRRWWNPDGARTDYFPFTWPLPENGDVRRQACNRSSARVGARRNHCRNRSNRTVEFRKRRTTGPFPKTACPCIAQHPADRTRWQII